MEGQQIGASQIRHIAGKLTKDLPGLGFALLVFEVNTPGVSNYISNCERESMIEAVEELLDRWKNNQDFQTREEN